MRLERPYRSNAPMDVIQLTPLLVGCQGGGVFITGSATVTFTNCDIYSNTATYVSALAPFGSSNAPMDALSRN